MSEVTVVHHSADFDGIFCREIAKKFLPNSELIGWDFGNPKIPWPDSQVIYVMDLPPDCLELPDINEVGRKMPKNQETTSWNTEKNPTSNLSMTT